MRDCSRPFRGGFARKPALLDVVGVKRAHWLAILAEQAFSGELPKSTHYLNFLLEYIDNPSRVFAKTPSTRSRRLQSFDLILQHNNFGPVTFILIYFLSPPSLLCHQIL
jgi:hypothetical protein